MYFSYLFVLLSVLVLFVPCYHSEPVDQHENCDFWASSGECDNNPDYMMNYCAYSCSKSYHNSYHVNSFYDIVEHDINGNELNFEQYRGKVVYIVNVASKCGYTATNYELLRRLKPYVDDGLEIMIAPCNQFGGQEPGDNDMISSFARKEQYQGIILSKGDVNGPSSRPVFAYLKSATGKSHINWNFDGKFLVGRDGDVHRVDQDSDLEKKIKELLQVTF